MGSISTKHWLCASHLFPLARLSLGGLLRSRARFRFTEHTKLMDIIEKKKVLLVEINLHKPKQNVEDICPDGK